MIIHRRNILVFRRLRFLVNLSCRVDISNAFKNALSMVKALSHSKLPAWLRSPISPCTLDIICVIHGLSCVIVFENLLVFHAVMRICSSPQFDGNCLAVTGVFLFARSRVHGNVRFPVHQKVGFWSFSFLSIEQLDCTVIAFQGSVITSPNMTL